MLTDSLRGHISSFRQSSKYPPLIYGVRHCLKLNCERNSPEAAHARLNWALNPLQLHKAGCEEVAQPPTTFHFTTIFTCTYCLYNKNANQGGQSMWDGNGVTMNSSGFSPLGRGWGDGYMTREAGGHYPWGKGERAGVRTETENKEAALKVDPPKHHLCCLSFA